MQQPYDHDRAAQRGVDRQEVLEEINRQRYDLEDEVGRDGVETYLPMLILLYLKSPDLAEIFQLPLGNVGEKIRKFFYDVLLVKTNDFGHSEEERLVMIATLLDKVVQGVVGPINLSYAMLESKDPERAWSSKKVD